MCPKRCGSGWWGSGVCREGAAGQPQLQLQGTGPAGAGEEVDVIGLTWEPPTHVPSPTVDMREMTVISHLLPSALTGAVAADLLLPAVGRGWDGGCGFRKVTDFWWGDPRPVTLFPPVFFCLDNPFSL